MNQAEVRQLLKKKDGSKIDAYMSKKIKTKQNQSDLMNLLQTWTHWLLYHKNIYPKKAFVERDILGITVQVASSPPLKAYLDEFFQNLRPHIDHLNHLQIVILGHDNLIIEVNSLHIDNLKQPSMLDQFQEENSKMPNRLQQQIEIKSFLYQLGNNLKQGFIRKDEEVTFRFRVGFRMEHSKNSRHNALLQDWIKQEPLISSGTILTSLKSPTLSLIAQVRTFCN